MKVRKLVSIALVFMCISASAVADKTDTMQEALKGIIHQHKIPDLSVGVIRSGKIVYIGDLHQRNDKILQTETGITRFRIASITKLFTAQAIMQLVEKDKLRLDDDVAVYIPEFKNHHITIQHLLTHHGGLQDKVWPEPFSEDSGFNAYLKNVLAVNPDIKPGIQFQYSDTGFNLLGKVIADVSGLPYHIYIERNILKPALMDNSGYYSGSTGVQPDVEPFKNGQLIPHGQQWPFDPQFFPSEGLISNVNDLSLWVQAVLTRSSKLLSKKSYKQMTTPLEKTSWEETRIGLGWFITRRHQIDYVYHMGDIHGYESVLVMEPSANNAIILLTNSSDVPRWEIVDEIERVLRDDEH